MILPHSVVCLDYGKGNKYTGSTTASDYAWIDQDVTTIGEYKWTLHIDSTGVAHKYEPRNSGAGI